MLAREGNDSQEAGDSGRGRKITGTKSLIFAHHKSAIILLMPILSNPSPIQGINQCLLLWHKDKFYPMSKLLRFITIWKPEPKVLPII